MKTKITIIFTVLNLLLTLTSVICLARIRQQNIAIDSVKPVFDYTETDDGVDLKLTDHSVVHLRFGEDGVSVTDSYLYDSPRNIAEILMFARYYAPKLGYELTRPNTELIGEYRLHTILYRLGYKPKQTGTLDWDYGDDPRWYVNAASVVLGRLGM